MRYYKIAVGSSLKEIHTLYDLITPDGHSLFFTIDDTPVQDIHYPVPEAFKKEISAITVKKNNNELKLEILPSVGEKLENIDPKKYSKGHLDFLRESHNEVAVAKVLNRVSAFGFLAQPPDSIVRVRTEDNKLYALYKGLVFTIGLTLRLVRLIGTVPNAVLSHVEPGPYTTKNAKFVFEKQTCATRDLVF